MSPLSDLLEASSACLESRGDEVTRWFAPRIAERAHELPVVAPVVFPFDGGIASYRSDDEHVDVLCHAVAGAVDQLAWTQPPIDRVPPGWAHRSALAGVIGPDAMIPESEFSFGFFYMSADTYYPHHWHQAEELYLALGGVTSFEIDGINTTLRPGDVSITPPMASHAITAGELGVLLLWGWRGDISYDSYAY